MALPPGPRTPGVLALLAFMRRPTESLEEDFRRYGDLYTIKSPLLGREVVIAHPELVKQLFTGDPDVYHAGEPNRLLAPLLGDSSVLLLDGAAHRRERKLVLPPFHGERLAIYAAEMREIADRVIDAMPLGEPFPLLPHMQKLTFDVILRTVFGVREGPTIDLLRDRVLRLVEKAQSPTGMWLLMPIFQRDLGPLTGWAAFQRGVREADEVIFGLIAEARAAGAAGAGRSDVLSLLLSARDEDGQPMTDRQLRDELMTLLLAGHETTAMALSWAVEELVRRPAVMARILAELHAVPAGAAPEAPLPYLDAAIKEVLRLRPLSPVTVRRTTRPVTLREHEIPAGTHLAINVYTTQRHPAFWESPNDLRPERFLDRKPDPYAWMPFGGGARRCIGMSFALMEMRIVLAALLGRARLRLPDPPTRVVLRSFLLAPEGGPRVALEARSPSAGAEPPMNAD